MAKSKEADNLEQLPPELESRVSDWRQRLLQLEPVFAIPETDRVCRYWELSKEIAELVAPRAERGARTRLMTALAARLECSRPQLYNLYNVGIVFADGLLDQEWTWHVKQARRLHQLSAEDRRRELEILATHRREPARRVAKARSSTPSPGERSDPEALRGEAEDAFARLDEPSRLSFLADQLGNVTADWLRFPIARALLRRVITAAEALHPLLPESPPTDTAKSGRHDRPPA